MAGWDQSVELEATQVDLLHYILRVLQVAHLQDPPTDDIERVPRPYPTEEEQPQKVGLDGLADFIKG